MKKIWIVLGLIAVVVLILIVYSGHTLRHYHSRVNTLLEVMHEEPVSVITEADIVHLPEPLQRYLKYIGVVGHEQVLNYKVIFSGQMRMDKDKEWAEVTAEQYSFTDPLTRLFFMKMKVSGLPVVGLHDYSEAVATWKVKLLGLIKVIDAQGSEMNRGETVTVFNDMCLLAPATLIDAPIEWETVDDVFGNNEYVPLDDVAQYKL